MKIIKPFVKFFESHEFKLGKGSKFFDKVYFPNIEILPKNNEVSFSYQSPYNYDIEIDIRFDIRTGNFIKGTISHLVNEWTYDINKGHKKIRGFEDDGEHFEALIKISQQAVREDLEQLQEVASKEPTKEVEGDKYFDTDFLRNTVIDIIKTSAYKGMF